MLFGFPLQVVLITSRQESIFSNMTSCNQLTLSSGSSQTANKQPQLRIRTNISFPISIEIYVPDENESVPYAFLLSMHTIRTADGCEKALLSGYFSALCAVLPDLTKVAYEVLENLGFKVKEIMVPSQKDAKYNEFICYDRRVEVLSFAQLIYIPFTKYFNKIGVFWTTVAQNARITLPIYLVPESDVKTLHSALMMSGLSAKLGSELYRSQQALSAAGTPFGVVFTEARKLVRYVEVHLISECRAYVLN